MDTYDSQPLTQRKPLQRRRTVLDFLQVGIP
jgi:hypothetical protein